jgi:DNA polymerase-1
MTTIGYAASERLTPELKSALALAVTRVYPGEKVSFQRGSDLGFGVDATVRTISPKQAKMYPNPENYLVAALTRLKGIKPQLLPGTLFVDIESHNAGKQWNMRTCDFFRLGQWAWGYDEVHTTTDYHEFTNLLHQANVIIGHNIHPFDMSVVFGSESTIALEWAQRGKIIDTMVLANQVMPAPYSYTNRKGHTFFDAAKPERALKWLSLDNLSYQLGLPGKEGDLRELAKRFNPPGTLIDDLDYSLIPTDDPDFLAYAVQDIVSERDLYLSLVSAHPMNEYDWREQLNAAIDAQNTRNGFRVDINAATARRDELAARKDVVMGELVEKYGLPTEGKMPWRSKVGKQAILKALEDVNITPDTRPDWPILKTGPSLGGQVMIDITEDTEAAEMGRSLAELMGQRSLAQLALDSTQDDGKVHPEITSLQRSGRKSTTKPGLTVWTSRGAGAIEKSYFIPDSPDESLIAFDYSQADARIVAALSGDKAFAERFADGVDAHELTGRLVFGDVQYDSNPYKFRQDAKQLGHAYAYRAGAKKLAATSKQPLSVAERFVDVMQRAYGDVTRWQNKVTDEGDDGYVVNDWGRCMVVDPDRSYTQSPALYGQSGTRELMVDALIRMLKFDIRIITWLKAQVHDELVFSIPNVELHWAPAKIKELMECKWAPSDGSGQIIEFLVGVGNPAKNWTEAGH